MADKLSWASTNVSTVVTSYDDDLAAIAQPIPDVVAEAGSGSANVPTALTTEAPTAAVENEAEAATIELAVVTEVADSSDSATALTL